MNEQELSDLFRKLGARNPQDWARSQLQENIPQLARFLFLRQAWRLVVADGDCSWISEVRQIGADSPGGEIGPALGRVLSSGCSNQDLTRIVRVMQWRLLFGICQLLDETAEVEQEVRDIAWRLFQVDENDRPTVAISGLIESVLETEPSRREMRPRDDE